MIKRLILTGIFFLGLVSYAQVVNIPDANLKNRLLNHDPVIDTNGDNEIQVTEAEALTGMLNVQSSDVSNAEGIQAFINISILLIGNNDLSSLPDISGLTMLEEIDFYSNNIGSIDLTGNTQLKRIGASNNNLSQLNVSQCPLLEFLSIHQNNFSSVDLSQNSALIRLSVDDNPLSSLDISNNPDLRLVIISDTNITSLDTSLNINLEAILAFNTQITSFDFQNNSELILLSATGFNGSSLDFSGTSIKHIYLSSSNLTSIDISSISTLEAIGFIDVAIADIDLSGQPNLCSVNFSNCSSLASINLKNGNNTGLVYGDFCNVITSAGYSSSANSGFFVEDCNNLNEICVDDVDYAELNFTQVIPNNLFIDNCFLGIDDFQNILVKIYPNPAINKLTIQSKDYIRVIEAYALSGQLINTIQINSAEKEFDVSYLSSGIYFLNVIGDQETKVLKLIKE